MTEDKKDVQTILEEYKVFCNMKENYVDRSFMTNKFYIVTIIALLVLMLIFKDIKFVCNISSSLIFAPIGIFLSILWWSNLDTYNILIKVKIANVIENIEKMLPIQPHIKEYEGIQEYKKNKKAVIFSDVQKGFAILLMLFFFAIFVYEATIPALEFIYGPIDPMPITELNYGK